ncbi:uncharacterized protein TNCV_1605481 [Trichonephila clavipes]|nr:uncharacterized protein TNCV_1605481 [Trichonephila clavipes]
MGLDEWNSWFKSQVRDSKRSQDIVNLNKSQLKTIEEIVLGAHTYEILITGRADREDRMSQIRMDREARVPRYWPKGCRGRECTGRMRPNIYGL